MGFAKTAFTALSYADPAISTFMYKAQGDSMPMSIAKGVRDFAFYEMLGPAAFGLLAKDVIMGIGSMAHQEGLTNARISSQSYKANFGGSYNDTQQAYTMRQRGLQAIQRNGLNARNVLGNEARMYSRGFTR